MTDLIVHLNNATDPTEDEVQSYLTQRAHEAHVERLALMPAGQFWTEGDLAKFTALRGWWPTDAPPVVGRPYLGVMLRECAGHPSLPPTETFGQKCERMWRTACAWLASEGRDLANPNESKEDRRRRKIREAVRRSRRLSAADDPGAEEVKRLHAEYIAACQARKAALAAVHEAHDPLIKAATDAWQEARARITPAS